MLHAENVASGGKLSFQNVGGGGGQRCIRCINFTQKPGGGQELTWGGANMSPRPPLNAALQKNAMHVYMLRPDCKPGPLESRPPAL